MISRNTGTVRCLGGRDAIKRITKRLSRTCLCFFVLVHPAGLTLAAESQQSLSADDRNKDPSPLTPKEKIQKENETYQSLEAFSRALALLENMYVDPAKVEPEDLIDKALRGIVASLDPHTTYLPAKELKEFTTDTTGKFGGIGVIIVESHGLLQIVEVVDESPSAEAGLKKGDYVYSVAGMKLNKENIEKALGQLKGLPGSRVEIGVIKSQDYQKWQRRIEEGEADAEPQVTSLTLRRAVIRTPSTRHFEMAPGYAYVRISVFQEDTGEQVDKALRKYEARNGGRLDGLVLDLRNNPGGLLDQAVKVADLFLDSGIIVSTAGRNREKQDPEFASARTTHPHAAMIILVNEGTASASEIVAGALQDHERALILGQKTFGKGSVQSIIPLPNGAGLKMTIARYYTPKGRSIQAKGIVPDITLSENTGSSSVEKEQRHSRRESDLKGHIEGADISKESTRGGFQDDIGKWPQEHQTDEELKTAYTYIKSWSRFARRLPLAQKTLESKR